MENVEAPGLSRERYDSVPLRAQTYRMSIEDSGLDDCVECTPDELPFEVFDYVERELGGLEAGAIARVTVKGPGYGERGFSHSALEEVEVRYRDPDCSYEQWHPDGRRQWEVTEQRYLRGEVVRRVETDVWTGIDRITDHDRGGAHVRYELP